MTRNLLENGSDNFLREAQGGNCCVINAGCDDESKIFGYRRNQLKTVLTYAGFVLTAFLLRLVFHWKPEWYVRCTHDLCCLRRAEKVVIRDQYRQFFVHDVCIVTKTGARVKLITRRSLFRSCVPDTHCVETDTGTRLLDPYMEDALIRYFYHKKIKYVWVSDSDNFAKIDVFTSTPCSHFHRTSGLLENDAELQRVKFGGNRVHIPLTPIWQLFVLKALHPFYIFQVFSVTLWYNDGYWMYATCIVIISTLSLSLSVLETARNERNLRMTLVSSDHVRVARGLDNYTEMDSDLLVPGDVIEIPKNGCVLQCDAVLIAGNCIVNESMLTGESVPVLKTPLPDPSSSRKKQQQQPEKRTRARPELIFNVREHNKHVLFCGTKVIQTRFVEGSRVRAVVVRTGFMTAKGEMIRSILFPKPMEFKFNQVSRAVEGDHAGVMSHGS